MDMIPDHVPREDGTYEEDEEGEEEADESFL